jgi:phospholipase/lecithinase/hemolysin
VVHKLVSALFVAFWIATQAQGASALSFSSLVAFGDSLTDTGVPNPFGRASNGPIWIDGLAAGLGLSSQSSDTGGTNYAVAGATTTGMLGQVSTYLSAVGGVADPNALYVVWGGGNDGLAAVNPPLTAASNIGAMLGNLLAAGAKYFLVPNLPDLSLTPAFLGSLPKSQFSTSFNSELATQLAAISGATVFPVDLYAELNAVVANPTSYGFTNVTSACPASSRPTCTTPDTYLFWDAIHPTTAGHAMFANVALAAIPEPGTGLLLTLGLAGLHASGRRARTAADHSARFSHTT